MLTAILGSFTSVVLAATLFRLELVRTWDSPVRTSSSWTIDIHGNHGRAWSHSGPRTALAPCYDRNEYSSWKWPLTRSEYSSGASGRIRADAGGCGRADAGGCGRETQEEIR